MSRREKISIRRSYRLKNNQLMYYGILEFKFHLTVYDIQNIFIEHRDQPVFCCRGVRAISIQHTTNLNSNFLQWDYVMDIINERHKRKKVNLCPNSWLHLAWTDSLVRAEISKSKARKNDLPHGKNCCVLVFLKNESTKVQKVHKFHPGQLISKRFIIEWTNKESIKSNQHSG